MSVPFSSLTLGKQWQAMHKVPYDVLPENPTVLDEIYLAIKERASALENDSLIADIEEFFLGGGEYGYYKDLQTDNWFYGGFFVFVQAELIGMVEDYINHVDGPLNGDSSDFLYFEYTDNYARWREIAGLHPYEEGEADEGCAFRRVVTWDGFSEPTYEYGYAQKGDAIGLWLLEDLQKAFSTLRWTVSDIGTLSTLSDCMADGIGTASETCPTLRQRLIDYWYSHTSLNWGSGSNYGGWRWSYMVQVYKGNGHPYSDSWVERRERLRGVTISGPVRCLSTIDIYFRPTVVGTGDTFFDFDGYGHGENAWFIQSTISSFTAGGTTVYFDIGNITTNPIELGPLSCPFQSEAQIASCYYEPHALAKWNFTNQNT